MGASVQQLEERAGRLLETLAVRPSPVALAGVSVLLAELLGRLRVAEEAAGAREDFGARAAAIRHVHAIEEYGDCVEDGEPFPCKTIRILDLNLARRPS